MATGLVRLALIIFLLTKRLISTPGVNPSGLTIGPVEIIKTSASAVEFAVLRLEILGSS